jgi:TRAP-type C4-dicarboxylate transport system permease small subunit
MTESLSHEGDLELQRGPLGRVLYRVCQIFALAGGMVLLALINMSLISIIGRKLFSQPIRGDIELMEMGAAVAIAAFLPLCEMRGLHIKVDAFTMWLAPRVQRSMDAVGHALCMLAALVLAWRTALQLGDNLEYGDVSVLLSIPMWVPLGLIVPSLLLLALASAWRVVHCLTHGGRR